jgi:hypothetical protein
MRGKPGEFPNTRVTCSEPIHRSSQFMVMNSAAGFGRGHRQRERMKIWAEEGLQPVRKLCHERTIACASLSIWQSSRGSRLATESWPAVACMRTAHLRAVTVYHSDADQMGLSFCSPLHPLTTTGRVPCEKRPIPGEDRHESSASEESISKSLSRSPSGDHADQTAQIRNQESDLLRQQFSASSHKASPEPITNDS